MWAESTPGNGATFNFTLSLAAAVPATRFPLDNANHNWQTCAC